MRKRAKSKIPREGLLSGSYPVFEQADPRPSKVVEVLGDIAGWSILELGSFEGGHTYQLENFGATVLGIEAHPQNYLKCLISKNILKMKSTFMLGDFMKWLDEEKTTHDLIFASGVLYHMPDPIQLIYLASQRSNSIFIWGHYVAPSYEKDWPVEFVSTVNVQGFKCKYFRYDYDKNNSDRNYAGTDRFCSRIRKDDILSALDFFGFTKLQFIEEQLEHPGGPALTVIASK